MGVIGKNKSNFIAIGYCCWGVLLLLVGCRGVNNAEEPAGRTGASHEVGVVTGVPQQQVLPTSPHQLMPTKRLGKGKQQAGTPPAPQQQGKQKNGAPLTLADKSLENDLHSRFQATPGTNTGLHADLFAKQQTTLQLFQCKLATHDYGAIHHHKSGGYDWWMFPNSYEKSQYKLQYCVYAQDIAALKKTTFRQNYLEGVRLLTLSWGWDLKGACPVSNPAQEQVYAQWNVRLLKMVCSLIQFEEWTAYHSLRKFFMHLLQQGIDFSDEPMLYDYFGCKRP